MGSEVVKGVGPVLRGAALAVAPVVVLLGGATVVRFGGGVDGYLQGLLAVALALGAACGGFLVSRPDRCPRCRRITEVAEDVQGLMRCAPCWLDEVGRPRRK